MLLTAETMWDYKGALLKLAPKVAGITKYHHLKMQPSVSVLEQWTPTGNRYD